MGLGTGRWALGTGCRVFLMGHRAETTDLHGKKHGITRKKFKKDSVKIRGSKKKAQKGYHSASSQWLEARGYFPEL